MWFKKISRRHLNTNTSNFGFRAFHSVDCFCAHLNKVEVHCATDVLHWLSCLVIVNLLFQLQLRQLLARRKTLKRQSANRRMEVTVIYCYTYKTLRGCICHILQDRAQQELNTMNAPQLITGENTFIIKVLKHSYCSTDNTRQKSVCSVM